MPGWEGIPHPWLVLSDLTSREYFLTSFGDVVVAEVGVTVTLSIVLEAAMWN